MTRPVTLSVRGEAELEVMPDVGVVNAVVEADERSKEAVLATIARRRDAVLTQLTELGGVRAEPGARVPFAWTAFPPTSWAESHWNGAEQVRTGRMLASVALRLDVRDYALLDAVESALAAHESVNVQSVSWTVDIDNPGWPRVRAAAIAAALQRGRDYAAALGGRLSHITQLADAGLLAAGAERATYQSSSRALAGVGEGAPGFAPVPQQLTATIEAQLVASVAALAGEGADLAQPGAT